jgi:hypothetical protein
VGLLASRAQLLERALVDAARLSFVEATDVESIGDLLSVP